MKKRPAASADNEEVAASSVKKRPAASAAASRAKNKKRAATVSPLTTKKSRRLEQVQKTCCSWIGFPCQDASFLSPLSSSEKARNCIDSKQLRTGSMFDCWCHWLGASSPGLVFVENVVGLLAKSASTCTSNAEAAAKKMQQRGYIIIVLIGINCLWLGRPQNRPRIWFIGCHMDLMKAICKIGNCEVTTGIKMFRRLVETRCHRLLGLVKMAPLSQFLLSDDSSIIREYFQRLPAQWEPRQASHPESWEDTATVGYFPDPQTFEASPGLKALGPRDFDSLLLQSSHQHNPSQPSNLSQAKERNCRGTNRDIVKVLERLPGHADDHDDDDARDDTYGLTIPCTTTASKVFIPSRKRLLHPVEAMRVQVPLEPEQEDQMAEAMKDDDIQFLAGNAFSADVCCLALFLARSSLASIAYGLKA